MIWATPRSEHVDWLFDFDTGGSSRLLYRVVSFAAILIWIWVGVEQHERNQPTHANVVAYISWYLWACDAYNDFDIEMNHKQSTSKAAVILQTRDIRAQRHKCGSTCWYYTNYTLHYIIVLRIYIYRSTYACMHTHFRDIAPQEVHCAAVSLQGLVRAKRLLFSQTTFCADAQKLAEQGFAETSRPLPFFTLSVCSMVHLTMPLFRHWFYLHIYTAL